MFHTPEFTVRYLLSLLAGRCERLFRNGRERDPAELGEANQDPWGQIGLIDPSRQASK